MRPTRSLAAAFLLLAAVAVRAIPTSSEARQPGDGVASEVAEPMQLLWAGGVQRLGELDVLFGAEQRGSWTAARRAASSVVGCPDTSEWLATSVGQRTERSFAELVSGSRTDAFCALTLLYQLLRQTSWDPGVFGGSEDAERLGALFAAWLESWSESAMDDALLREPALATFLAYGLVMDAAARGNAFSSSAASRDRAHAALHNLLGEPGRHLSAFGAGVANRYPRAFEAARESDALERIAREARLWFPDVDGDCDG